MQVKARYSHLNGEEYLLVHRKQLWEEVQAVIGEVDAFACRTKVSREKTMQGRMLFSPADMNRAFSVGLRRLRWGIPAVPLVAAWCSPLTAYTETGNLTQN